MTKPFHVLRREKQTGRVSDAGGGLPRLSHLNPQSRMKGWKIETEALLQTTEHTGKHNRVSFILEINASCWRQEINVESTLNIYHQRRGRTTTPRLAPVRNSSFFKTIIMCLLFLGVSPCCSSCTVARWNADLMLNGACINCWKVRCREHGGYYLGLSVLECDNTHSPRC